MSHRKVRAPSRLVDVEPILPEPAKIDNAEIGTSGRTGVVVVRSGFTEIVEAGPDEFTGDIRIPVLPFELHIGDDSPGGRVKVIRTDLSVRESPGFVVGDREEVFSKRADT